MSTDREPIRGNWLSILLVTASAIACAILVGAAAGTQDGKRVRAPEPEQQPLIDSIRGDHLFRAYCASCHGSEAKGNGPLAAWLKVQPPDLTRIAARNGGQFPLERVDGIISGEEALPGGHGTRAMPVWGPVFSKVTRDQDLGKVRIDNLARYLRDIQAK